MNRGWQTHVYKEADHSNMLNPSGGCLKWQSPDHVVEIESPLLLPLPLPENVR